LAISSIICWRVIKAAFSPFTLCGGDFERSVPDKIPVARPYSSDAMHSVYDHRFLGFLASDAASLGFLERDARGAPIIRCGLARFFLLTVDADKKSSVDAAIARPNSA
jgi:hypothetical protein